MTHTQYSTGSDEVCPFCGKLPGTKVGPPAMARCVTEGCEGRNLAAVLLTEWNTRATPSSTFPADAVRDGDSTTLAAVDTEAQRISSEAFALIRLGARAMRLAAEADCGNHSEGAQEDAMTSGGLTKLDKQMLSAHADAADEIRKQIKGTCEDSALGYLSYMGSDDDRACLKSLGVTSDWLYRKENDSPSRAEIAKGAQNLAAAPKASDDANKLNYPESSQPVGRTREETIEECAKIADTCRIRAQQTYGAAESVGAHMAARSIRRLLSLPADALPLGGLDRPVVSIKPMELSDGRMEYFVSIKVGDREVTPHVFRDEYKAAYHAALYDWLLNGTGDEPDIIAFGPRDWPARVVSPSQPMQGFDNGEPVLWVCLVPGPAPAGGEVRIRAWTADRKRMESLRAEGLDMQPLFPSPQAKADGGRTPLDLSPAELNLFASRDALAKDIAITICLSYGRDPDEPTSILEMCDGDNQPVPTWMVYVEQAEAILDKFQVMWRTKEAPQALGAGSNIEELLTRAETYLNINTPDGRGSALLVMELADALRASLSLPADALPLGGGEIVTDAMCEAALESDTQDRIQGFTYDKRHVIRDVWMPPQEQELWSSPVGGTDEYQAFQKQCRIERMRRTLAAALAHSSTVCTPGTEGK
ncbi:MAG: hypothetical protein JWR80_10015 [Bradyrhizobium sp.]|nr:hypothetical protein [Bradyrhizobium sp.]